jgi:hypothetical protein
MMEINTYDCHEVWQDYLYSLGVFRILSEWDALWMNVANSIGRGRD